MRKCPDCNGCLQYKWFRGETYKYCALCRTVYKVEPGGFVTKIEDKYIIDNLFLSVGNVV